MDNNGIGFWACGWGWFLPHRKNLCGSWDLLIVAGLDSMFVAFPFGKPVSTLAQKGI
jgi:hypothetical protein